MSECHECGKEIKCYTSSTPKYDPHIHLTFVEDGDKDADVDAYTFCSMECFENSMEEGW